MYVYIYIIICMYVCMYIYRQILKIITHDVHRLVTPICCFIKCLVFPSIQVLKKRINSIIFFGMTTRTLEH